MSNGPRRVEITDFPQGKRIAVTTSFDDGQTFDRRIVEAFNEWGLKATFNINSGILQRTGDPAIELKGDGVRTPLDVCEIRELYRGHEVAIHTVSHPWLNRLDALQITREILDDRLALEQLVGHPVRGMAYPFGAYNPLVIEIARSLGIVYSRATGTADPCFPPVEPLAWAPTAHQYATMPGGDDVPGFFAKWYAQKHTRGVFYIWGHAYEFEDRDDWAGVERIYKPLSGKADVWYCTNIELFDYEAARRRLILSADRTMVQNPSSISVWIDADGRLCEVKGGATVKLSESGAVQCP